MTNPDKEEMTCRKCGRVINIEPFMRYTFLPSCANRILDYLEDCQKPEGDKLVIEMCELFSNVVLGFWWQVHMTENVVYRGREPLDDKELRPCIELTAEYATLVFNRTKKALAIYDNSKLPDFIGEALDWGNAGITYGAFSEYTALSLAMRYTVRLCLGIVHKVTQSVFGKDACLSDVELMDERLNNWYAEIRSDFLEELPPVSEWPKWKAYVDAESVTYKIGIETSKILDFLRTSGKTVTRAGRRKYCSEMMEKQPVKEILECIMAHGKLKRAQIVSYTGRRGGYLNAKLSNLVEQGLLLHDTPYFDIAPEYRPVLLHFRNISGK